jgi:hypothetical protein
METVGSRKLSSEQGEGDYHDDDGLIDEGEKGEAWYRGDEMASLRLSRPRDILMLWAILFSVLIMSISQAWWLASDAIYSNTCEALNRVTYPTCLILNKSSSNLCLVQVSPCDHSIGVSQGAVRIHRSKRRGDRTYVQLL